MKLATLMILKEYCIILYTVMNKLLLHYRNATRLIQWAGRYTLI